MKRYENDIMQQMADDAIAHGALTNSKRPSCFVKGVYPTHMKRGLRSYLYDADGNRYIDLVCGLGTNYFGYNNQKINQAVTSSMNSGGSVFSLASCEEVNYAQRLKGVFPFLERVRFLKSGSEGCSAAVRIARAFTGRELVLTEGYHGWHDLFVSLTPPAVGIPHHEMIEQIQSDFSNLDGAACVIIEPIITNDSMMRIEWLHRLRDACNKFGVVLIFDECITAVRYKSKSVVQAYNIIPDLWIAGKALGGGLPISVVGGKREVMESDYFISSTWAGDRLSFSAGLAAIDLMHTSTYDADTVYGFGEEFKTKFNALSRMVQIDGYGTRGTFRYSSDVIKALFMQEMVIAGVLIGPSWFYNRWHKDEEDNILSIASSVMRKIIDGKAYLKGEMPKSPFAERVRNA